jgi:cold shock CspA family protein
MTHGRVVAFDDAAGHGTVRADGADADEYFFHCTAIADGTRTIEVDALVTFDVVAGRRGQWEAARLAPR